MGLIRWIKEKVAGLDRRAGEWTDRTAPARQRKAEDLKQMIAETEAKLARSKGKP